MNGRRARELRQLVEAKSPIKGQIPHATVLAGDKSVVLIKGANKRTLYRALKKNYRRMAAGQDPTGRRVNKKP